MPHLRGEADGPTPPPVAAREPHPRWTPRVYAIVGPDGAGKTTIARGIVHRLAQRGIKTRIVWMRSPRIVTLGVLGILRMSRLAKTVRMGDHDDVHVDLRRHPRLLQLYAWSVTFDYFLGYFGKVTLSKRILRRTVLSDRFAWDTLVDLGLASGVDEGFLDLPPGRILLDLAKKHRSVLVTASSGNSSDGSRSFRWTRGSRGDSASMPGSRTDSDSVKSTAGRPRRRRAFPKFRNTSGSVPSDRGPEETPDASDT